MPAIPDAPPSFPSIVQTRLVGFRRIYSIKPDALTNYLNGIAVNNTGLASDVGVGGKRGCEE
jgi:hypothetical protein